MNKKMFLLLLFAQTMHGLVSIGRSLAVAAPQEAVQDSIKYLADEIQALCDALQIKILLDIGCGDFWMRKLNMPNMFYIGVDASPEKIVKNRVRYGNDEHVFLCADPLEDALPKADMIIGSHLLYDMKVKKACRLLHVLKDTGTTFLMIPVPKKKMRIACNLSKPLVKVVGYNEETGDDETWGLWLLQELNV